MFAVWARIQPERHGQGVNRDDRSMNNFLINKKGIGPSPGLAWGRLARATCAVPSGASPIGLRRPRAFCRPLFGLPLSPDRLSASRTRPEPDVTVQSRKVVGR